MACLGKNELNSTSQSIVPGRLVTHMKHLHRAYCLAETSSHIKQNSFVDLLKLAVRENFRIRYSNNGFLTNFGKINLKFSVTAYFKRFTEEILFTERR